MPRAQFPHWLYFRHVYQRSSGLSFSRGQVRQVENEGASQINYIVQVVQPILENHISSVEVDVGPTDAYNKMLHSSLAKSVFAQCMSWYRVGGTGKITNGFPLYVIFLLVCWSLRVIGPSLGQPPYFGFGSASPIGITTTPLAPTDGWKDNFFGKDVVSKFGGLLQ